MSLAPIVLFTYNRPKHLKITLDSLKKNKLSKKSDIHIFSDGPKTTNKLELKKIKAVKKILINLRGFRNKKLFFYKSNVGLKKNILNGISKILKKYSKIIVLEDDIVVNQYFLDFMNQSLDFYKKNKKIWHISGWNYNLKKINVDNLNSKDGKTFFIKNMNCWGWGTWRNRWEKIIINPEFFIKKMSNKKIYDFNLSDSLNNWSQLTRNKTNKLNTWAIFWNATIFYYNGLCLNPIKSLTKNIGLDGSGANSSIQKKDNSRPSKVNFFIFSKIIKENLTLRNEIIAHMKLKNKKDKWDNFKRKFYSIFRVYM